MSINEILSVLWHQKVILLASIATFIAVAFGGLELVTPEYQSTSTLALSPRNLDNDLVFFQTIDSIVPIYAAAAQTQETKDIARSNLGGNLAQISVQTFTGAPLLKIVARGANKSLVRESAQSVTSALQQRVAAGAVGVPSLRLEQIERPVYPTSPVFPRKTLTLAIAGLLGLAFGIGAAFLRESLTNKVRSQEDLAGAAEAPVYAELPFENALARQVSPGLFLAHPPLDGVTEGLRDLRTSLLFPSGTVRSVTITSPHGRHGKTTIALGLAVTMARAGTRTLLVDGDLRRGRLAEVLELEPVPGLREVMAGLRPESAIRTTSLPELDVLTSGRLATDPGELLERFPQVLEQLEHAYDTVVVDTTPLTPVGDARVIASATGSTVLVASAGAASRDDLRQAVERLALVGISPAGTVLNKSRSRRSRGYYSRTSKDGAVGTVSDEDEVAGKTIRERV
jgi:capsular exopolysaccharide synthesis family protein